MFNAITHHQIWVLDQDEALDFYVGKLGLEVVNDVDMEVMRWLTVAVPGQPERQIVLMLPEPPAVDPASVDEVRDLVAKGNGGMFILTTDDCRADYERLVAKGVEFTEEPTERFYGIDCGFRDPFG
ncbi:MAG TPA: VOC family protein, partial [Solirubrobacteraceae bacterium]|nr:VOC family protein [Solirubrobacteraceae bacterium]